MSTHLKVPLKNLRFGHEAPKHPSNARVTGRLDGIEALAANIFARGLIEDLIVFDDGVKDTWFVADGNRSLAALRLIHGDDSSEPIDCKSRPADMAFEDSLAVAVMGHKLHPIDEFEGYAKLRDDRGKSEAEIAQQYGKTLREVAQVMALGHLSAAVRDAWRKGELQTSAAKAFTLLPDHKAQDELLAKLRKHAEDNGDDLSRIDEWDIKDELDLGNDGELVEFIGIDAYVKRGGKVEPDLFGTDHRISDVKLAKAMAAEKLADECKRLIAAGWAFAVTSESVRNSSHGYGTLKVEAEATPEEEVRLADLKRIFDGGERQKSVKEMTGAQHAAWIEHRELKEAIRLRPYTIKLMATAGCFVGIDDDGMLEVEYGRVKPKAVAAAAKAVKEEKKELAKSVAKVAAAEGKPPPEPKHLSNALTERLEAQLIHATRDAIAAEPQLANSLLFETLARAICSMIQPDRYGMPDKVRTKLPSIRQVLNPGVFNAAIAKRFEAEDYFSNAPKGFVLRAIAEGINSDESRRVMKKPKADIAKFAIASLAKTGWLPKELRTVHYAGPGSEGYKASPAEKRSEPRADEKTTALPPRKMTVPTPAQSAATRHAHSKPTKTPVKRVAATKKAATKTSTKKKQR